MEPMDPFRLILLAVGIILLMVVYYVTKRATDKQITRPRKRQIPMSGHVSPPERPYQATFETNKPQRRKRFVQYLSSGSSQSSANQKMYDQATALEPFAVTVYVMPLAGLQFRHDQVIACMESVGCVPRSVGSDTSYDYLIIDDEHSKKVNKLFNIRDAHQPGVFSHAADAPEKTNGLVFEMQLPGPMESVMAFERLLDVARRVATKLNGIVCDDLQNRLTKQATLHIKDKIVDYNRKLRYVHSSSVQ
jgi:cell division protein ZipA